MSRGVFTAFDLGGLANFFGGGIPCFAPTREAAEIESSKTFSKNFMRKYNIPTADYRSFRNYEDARQYIDTIDCSRVVIKVDGLAAGKGVILPESRPEALQALREIMVDNKFGHAGSSAVIEEHLEGDEISILTFTDGKSFKSLPPGQDHKRIFDGNKGPNTGGMGVYAPVSFITGEQHCMIEKTIIQPTLDGLANEGELLNFQNLHEHCHAKNVSRPPI